MIRFNSQSISNKIIIYILLFYCITNSQTHLVADSHYLLLSEKASFNKSIPNQVGLFRPIFYNTDSLAFALSINSETYYNNNAPNQENMDVRYFSKGVGNYKSIRFSANSPYFSLLFEPYIINNQFFPVQNINGRNEVFQVLNDRELRYSTISNKNPYNFAVIFNYRGFGFGWHKGNRWWGPGLHSSLQMTNNTQPFLGQVFGTMREVRIGPFGVYAVHTFAKINEKTGNEAKYFTSLNGQITWYSSANITLGFSRNYLTGGSNNFSDYFWSEKDAKLIVFEGIFTSNLIGSEYTVGGHDIWDQTISLYAIATLPKKSIKIYAEFGANDNRMYFADFLSQPDHSMATIFGVRDYGVGNRKNIIWGFEWTNLMISYSSRHRPTGPGTWYNKIVYDYSTYMGRRWAAHSGTDSDDWLLFAGYLSDKFMFVPAINYERHGIVSYRPAEVKMELKLDTRYKFNDIWFGLYYEKQFEAFLGFPNYFYEDASGKPIDSSEGKLANQRSTNTLIFTINKTINF